MRVARYTPDDAEAWNDFVSNSRNATFLHNRNYMDYHADRFKDHSLIATDDEGNIIALLPASWSDERLISHRGLTYGGLLLGKRTPLISVMQCFDEIKSYTRKNGFSSLTYKPVPHIYHRLPSEDDLYALFRLNAQCIRVDASTTISLKNRPPYSKGKKYAISKAIKAGYRVKESNDFETYFSLLNARLDEKYGVAATHTAAEMILLKNRFPNNIRLFATYEHEQMIAGLIVYDCDPCAHAQYMAANEVARENGGLDLAINMALSQFSDRDYFDFGISTEQHGRFLNEGLARQKEMFGGQTTVYITYNLPLDGC